MSEHLQELEMMKANWKKGVLGAARTHLGEGSLERWGGFKLVVGVMPDEKKLIVAECRHRLATSLFKHADSMAEMGEDIGVMADSQLTAKQAGILENKRRRRVSLLDDANAQTLLRLDPRYTVHYLASLPLSEASKLENKRRRRVSLLDDANAQTLLRLDPRYTPQFLDSLTLPEASSMQMRIVRGSTISTKVTRAEAHARDSPGVAGGGAPTQTTLKMGAAIVRLFVDKYDPANDDRRSAPGPSGDFRILFSDCFPRSNADQVEDWESAVIEIVRRIDERGVHPFRNIASAAHLQTSSQDFEQQNKLVVAALESVLPGVYTARTFTNQDKDTLTARIKAHGNDTFSTAGLASKEARKKIMDTYHLIKTDFVINTVRNFSQNDRVALATHIILLWYNKHHA